MDYGELLYQSLKPDFSMPRKTKKQKEHELFTDIAFEFKAGASIKNLAKKHGVTPSYIEAALRHWLEYKAGRKE